MKSSEHSTNAIAPIRTDEELQAMIRNYDRNYYELLARNKAKAIS